MKLQKSLLGFLFTFLCMSSMLANAELTFPALTGRVVDVAQILSSSTEVEITRQLKEQEQKTGNQVVVVTLDSLQGTSIEDYGYQLGRRWGIGQKGKDDGALLIIAPTEREMRIEVGYGLEGVLTDAQSSQIINQVIAPYFKKQQFDAGVKAGVAAMLAKITAPPTQLASNKKPQLSENIAGKLMALIFFFAPLFMVFGFRRSRRRGIGPFIFGTLRRGGSSGGGFSGRGGGFGGGGASGGW